MDTSKLDRNSYYYFFSRHKKGDFSISEKLIFLCHYLRPMHAIKCSHTGVLFYCPINKYWKLMHSRGTGLQITPCKTFLKTRVFAFIYKFEMTRQKYKRLNRLFDVYNDRPYDKWSIINFASRILLHRNIKKTNKNEALFCSEWNCMVVEELEGIDIPKMLGLKSREYVTPIDFFNGLVLSNKQTR